LRDERGTRPLAAAGIYFAVCWLVAAGTGVLGDLVDGPLSGQGHDGAGWWLLSAWCLSHVVVAYWVIWPIGTYTLDRRRHEPSVLAYGIVWGVSQGLLFLSVLERVARVVDGRAARVAVAFVALSVFQGAWHALVYDRLVSPPHNDPAWNLRKVLLCHVPTLLLTLWHVVTYGAPAFFLLCQVIALTGSSWFMRWPDVRPLTPSPTRP
jgi:uncharacterized membrane protein